MGYGKLILQHGPRGNGRAHARRAEEKSAGHEQRGAAPAAQMQKAPGKQQYGGADQQDALRQPAVPRQKRAEAKERGGRASAAACAAHAAAGKGRAGACYTR